MYWLNRYILHLMKRADLLWLWSPGRCRLHPLPCEKECPEKVWGKCPDAPPPAQPEPISSCPNSRWLLLQGVLLFRLPRHVQIAGVVVLECSSRKGCPFPGAFLGWTLLGKAVLRAAPDHWADVDGSRWCGQRPFWGQSKWPVWSQPSLWFSTALLFYFTAYYSFLVNIPRVIMNVSS